MEIMSFELALTCYFAATIVCVLELFKGTKTTSKILLTLVVIGVGLFDVWINFRRIGINNNNNQ